ncbi:hypothetical protein F6X40_23780 [Paraburkholderia sp. UCT31]|uniref:glyoxalase superfamily protein n=1 Tax=Paraburkholderia sp. UCT31 TaxID=2615209 RepID=UPI001655DEE4|nr:glyoxalase superfamily protein [Paraburkholderia sp. UCT31]MBC8739737.1 hypothetical protein [Paraburkholderia sp. UCT31]
MLRIPDAKSQARLLVEELQALGLEIQNQHALDVVAKLQGFRNWNVMQGTPAKRKRTVNTVAPEREVDGAVLRNYNPNQQIAVTWSIGDVLSVRADLTDDEAFDVLHIALREHDATTGITYDVLQSHADYAYPRRRFPCTIQYTGGNGTRRSVRAEWKAGGDRSFIVEGDPSLDLSGDSMTVVFDALPGQTFEMDEDDHAALFESSNESAHDLAMELLAAQKS